MGMIDLKPCPFCGGTAIFKQTSYGTAERSVRLGFEVACGKCGATEPQGHGEILIKLSETGSLNPWRDCRAKAAVAWNRRAKE